MENQLEAFLKYVENKLANIYDGASKLQAMPLETEENKAAFEAAKLEFGTSIVTAKNDITVASQNMVAAISADAIAQVQAAIKEAVTRLEKEAIAAAESKKSDEAVLPTIDEAKARKPK